MTSTSINEPQDEQASSEIGKVEEDAAWRDACRRTEAAQVLETLYETRGPEAFRYLRFLGARPQIADDVLHDAFLNLGRHLLKEQIHDPAPYLFVAVRNAWLDWLRKAEHRRTQLADDIDKEYADPAAEEALEKILDDYDQRATFQAVRTAVGNLAPRQREIVALHDVIGLSVIEVSEVLKLTPGAIRYHLSLGRRRLKELLKLDGVTEGEYR